MLEEINCTITGRVTFGNSSTGFVVSDPARDMDICSFFSDLATMRYPSKAPNIRAEFSHLLAYS